MGGQAGRRSVKRAQRRGLQQPARGGGQRVPTSRSINCRVKCPLMQMVITIACGRTLQRHCSLTPPQSGRAACRHALAVSGLVQPTAAHCSKGMEAFYTTDADVNVHAFVEAAAGGLSGQAGAAASSQQTLLESILGYTATGCNCAIALTAGRAAAGTASLHTTRCTGAPSRCTALAVPAAGQPSQGGTGPNTRALGQTRTHAVMHTCTHKHARANVCVRCAHTLGGRVSGLSRCRA